MNTISSSRKRLSRYKSPRGSIDRFRWFVPTGRRSGTWPSWGSRISSNCFASITFDTADNTSFMYLLQANVWHCTSSDTLAERVFALHEGTGWGRDNRVFACPISRSIRRLFATVLDDVCPYYVWMRFPPDFPIAFSLNSLGISLK